MRRFLLIGTLLFSALPALAHAAEPQLISPRYEKTTHASHPSRRTLRREAQRPIGRNPHLLSIQAFTLDATFRSEPEGITLHYPSNWEVVDHPQSEPPLTLVAMFLSPRIPGSAIRTNINLVIEDLPSPLTLSDYTALGIATEQKFFDQYTLISSEQTRLAGAWPAQRVVFTAPTDNGLMKFEQIWTLLNRTAHVWTFADDEKTFEKNIPMFERMLESLTMEK